MTVTAVDRDVKTRTLTITAEFAAPRPRVWQLWADPRQLERWWGPPTYPATVETHELVAGGRVTYFMTGPEGDRHYGYWEVRAVGPERTFEFEDGFADEHGVPNPALPQTLCVVTLTDRADGGTVMTIESRFSSIEAMERLIQMGMEEGMQQALSQTDAILAA